MNVEQAVAAHGGLGGPQDQQEVPDPIWNGRRAVEQKGGRSRRAGRQRPSARFQPDGEKDQGQREGAGDGLVLDG
jgi:hypothetical protein